MELLRGVGKVITIVSLTIIALSAVGLGLYFGITSTPNMPTWIGDILTTLAGGMLAMLGSYFALSMNQRNKRRAVDLKQRSYQVKPYRSYLTHLYYMLSRKVYANTTDNHDLGKRIDLSPDEITRFTRSMPPLGFMYLVRDKRLSEGVQTTIEDGLQLLNAKVNDSFFHELRNWSDRAKDIIEKLDQYEKTAL